MKACLWYKRFQNSPPNMLVTATGSMYWEKTKLKERKDGKENSFAGKKNLKERKP